MTDFTGQTALATRGAVGIGAAIVRTQAPRGAANLPIPHAAR
jgi:hypothetical protein